MKVFTPNWNSNFIKAFIVNQHVAYLIINLKTAEIRDLNLFITSNKNRKLL